MITLPNSIIRQAFQRKKRRITRNSIVIAIIIGLLCIANAVSQNDASKKEKDLYTRQVQLEEYQDKYFNEYQKRKATEANRDKWKWKAAAYSIDLDKKMKELYENDHLIAELKEARRVLVTGSRGAKRQVQEVQIARNEDLNKEGYKVLGVFVATAYCPSCAGSITSTGTRVAIGTIAVDPRVIPYGTKLNVEGYGNGTALDCGGAIKGNKIDVWVSNSTACSNWGRRSVKVWVR